ncbi:MAG: 3-oxoadipate enol-lactonase/4-carboxymuconolactone decarboxylase [Yoonia sp.]|jgi:3-oxoadipate enol-lactonase/4-carboxymuconolactone decarboxylase
MDVIKINGAHVAYRHRPSLGRTIVFANSLGSDQSIWDDVIAALPAGFGVLTYDLRGHGLSGGVAESIEGLADDASQLIDALGLTDVMFCGVSIGGMIGQVLAAKRSDVIRAAVLCNTACQIGTDAKWKDRIAAVEQGGVASIADMIVGTWFGPAYAAQSDRIALHQAMVARTTNAGYVAACRAICAADLRGYAAAITVPVLCVGGSDDGSVPPDAVRALVAQIADANVVMLNGLGHLPCLETPGLLAQLIDTFDPPPDTRANAGMAIRRAVLSDAHVDLALVNVSPLDEAFQTLITEGAWGTVWASPGISTRDRSMLTLALLAAIGNFEEIPMHIRATARTGATARDITEAFQHVAIYAGVPKANHALKLAKQTLADMEKGADD